MSHRRRVRRALIAVVCVVAVAAGAAFAAQGAWLVTAKGLGPITLGRSYAALRAKGYVGKLQPGCPLTGVKTYGARLAGPRHGAVTLDSHHRVTDIAATAGVLTFKHAKIGDTSAHILALYPSAHYDRAKPSDPIPFGLIQVSEDGTPQFSFLINATTHRVVQIDVPSAQFCE